MDSEKSHINSKKYLDAANADLFSLMILATTPEKFNERINEKLMKNITRLVVVNDNGRVMDVKIKDAQLSFQDANRTLKVFVTNTLPENSEEKSE